MAIKALRLVLYTPLRNDLQNIDDAEYVRLKKDYENALTQYLTELGVVEHYEREVANFRNELQGASLAALATFGLLGFLVGIKGRNLRKAEDALTEAEADLVKASEDHSKKRQLYLERGNILTQRKRTLALGQNQYLTDYWSTSISGEAMSFEFETELMGGLREWTITFKNKVINPVAIDTHCEFHVDGVVWFTGFVTEFQTLQTDSPTIELKGKGYWEKLAERRIRCKCGEKFNSSTKIYTVMQTILDETSKYFGLRYSAVSSLDNLPDITIGDIDFDGMKFDDAIETCLNIAGSNLNDDEFYTAHYTNTMNFVIVKQKPVDNSTHYFEGYDYFRPEVDFNTKDIRNNVALYYKTKKSDTEFFERSISDSSSIRKYGQRDVKITTSCKMSKCTDDNCAPMRLAQRILKSLKDPKKRMTIKGMAVSSVLPYGYRSFVSKPQDHVIPLRNFGGVSDETPGGTLIKRYADGGLLYISDATIAVEKSLLYTHPNPSATSKYIISLRDERFSGLPHPKSLNGFFRLTESCSIVLGVEDTLGNLDSKQICYSNNTPTEVWHSFSLDLKPEFCYDLLSVKPSIDAEAELLDVHSPTIDHAENLEIECITESGVYDVKQIDFIIDRVRGPVDLYISGLNLVTKSHIHDTLIWHKAKYKIGQARTVDLELGDTSDSLVDSIKKEATRLDKQIDFNVTADS